MDDEHSSDTPSEVEQPFWNSYPIYTPSAPCEGNQNVNVNVPPQNVDDNMPDVHASPIRNAPRVPAQNVIHSPSGI